MLPIMKKFLTVFASVLWAIHGFAQESDPLSVTLPSGRVVHFETEDQKAKFVAARERVAAATPAPAAPPASVPAVASTGMGHTAADAVPAMSGRVNVSAPTFTADYYLLAPDTWVEKPVTVSAAYVRRENSSRADGLVELRANTYGTLQGNGEQREGGHLMIVATPAAAERISTLAGTHYQYNGYGLRTTLFKGTFKKSSVGEKGYYVYVDK